MVAESLRILILEDNPADAELIQFELEEAGLIFTPKVVMTEEDFVRAIQEFSPDLILSDYDLPKYNGALALAEARRRCPDTPFILVTGAVTEDRAIDILTQGAKDYVLKTRLQQRLVPAVKRALAEAEEQRARKQMEVELREARKALEEKVQARTSELEILNRQLQALFDYSAASLVLFDAKRPYTVIAHNKYYQELWDEPFRTKGMVGKNLLDYVPAVEQSGVMAVYDEVVQTRQAKNLLSFPYDGMPRGRTWWNWHLSPIMQDGKVIALAHMGIDITKEVLAREEAERRAKEAEEGKNTLDTLMACIPEGITIVNAPDVITTMLSKYGSDLLLQGWETAKDLSMEDWLAKVEHYMPDGHTPVRIEDLPLWRAVKGGETVEGQEFSLRSPTGELVPILCNAAPIRDKDGKITGGIVAWRDITVRKQVEEALRESEERLRETLRSVADEIWIIDTQGCIVSLSDSVRENLGVSSEKWADIESALDQLEILRPDGTPRPREDAPLSRALRGEVTRNEEEMIRNRATGQLRWREVSGAPVRYEEGRIIGAVVVARDITERKRAEDALKLQAAIMESVAEGIFLIGFDDNIIKWTNRKFELLFGYGPGEMVGMHVDKVNAPTERTPTEARISIVDVLRQTGEWHGEMENIKKDGTHFWCHIHVSLFDHPEFGTVMVSAHTDITERRKAEEAVRESEEKFRSIVETANEGILLAGTDGKITFANERMGQIVGYTVEEMIGMTGADLVADPEELARAQDLAKKRQAGLRSDYEIRMRRRDASEVWLLASGSPVYDDTGRHVGNLGMYFDITKRKQAEDRLRESEEKYRNLLKYAPAAIYEMDLKGTKFFSVNDAMCDILGYSREELLSMKPTDLLDQEGRQLFKERIRKKLAGEKIDETIEYHIKRKDREWIQVAVYLGGYTYTNESPTRVAVVAYDITEQKKAEKSLKERTQQLENANKELESFSYSVSHDLRAPLRAIDGYSKMILRQQGDKFDENTKHQFDVIRQNTKMMGQLIDDLLALSRLGREALSLSKLSMEDMTRDVWKELKVINSDTPVDLRICDIPPVMGDRSLIKQVLVNILSNAVKFSKVRETPVIEVSGYEEEREIIYYIRDNGIGFDMQYHDKLFGVFQRLHSSTEYEGTGVGLAIVQRIIHRHGGRIWAEGEVDKGATFYFTLPIRKE